mgnify:CR=1 FL=1
MKKKQEGKIIISRGVNNIIQKALRYQSKNIVIDSIRVKRIQDRSIRTYLIKRMKRKHGIQKLVFVTKMER